MVFLHTFLNLVKKIKTKVVIRLEEFDFQDLQNNMQFENYMICMKIWQQERLVFKNNRRYGNTGSDYLDGTISQDVLITYKPGETVICRS